MPNPSAPSSRSRSTRRIETAEIMLARQQGPAVLQYYQTSGLAEVRRRATDLVLSGLICLGGMLVFDWTALTMLVFMIADAQVTVIADILKYLSARRWIAESHRIDHEAGTVLLIGDGLDDGSGTYPDRGSAPVPGMILLFGVAASLFLLPIAGIALTESGTGSLLDPLTDRTLHWVVLTDLVLRLISAIYQILRARAGEPGQALIFMESGSVAVLYAGLLILVWLPLQFGNPGMTAMFVVLYVVRISFGIFALYWTPRSVRSLARRVSTGDFTVQKQGGSSS